MSSKLENNLVHAQNLVVNDPVALLIGEQKDEYTKEELLETIALLRLYLGKTLEICEKLRQENVNDL